MSLGQYNKSTVRAQISSFCWHCLKMMNDYDGEDFQIDNENNTLYHTFKDSHPCWLFLGNAILKAIYVTPGIFMNIAVIFVTIRSKSLRSTANYLLALTCLFEVFHQPGHFLSIFMALSGFNFLHYPLAVRISSLPIFGLIAVGPSLFFTGIDRLFAVTFLSFYQRVNLAIYLLSILAVCSAYSGYTLFLVYKNANLLDNLQVTGNIGDLLQGEASQFYYKYTLILNSVTICIYIAVGIIIRFRSGKLINCPTLQSSLTVDQTNKRIFRSLFAIILINIGGYYLMRIYTNFIVPNVLWSPITVWTVRQIFSIPLNLSAGSNGPILYLTSVEYKKAFREEFGIFINFLRRQKKEGTKVQPITNNTQIIRQKCLAKMAIKGWNFNN